MAEGLCPAQQGTSAPPAPSNLHPTLRESLHQELTEPRVHFDPSGKQRKG